VGAGPGTEDVLAVDWLDVSGRAALELGPAAKDAAADAEVLIPPPREVCPADIRPQAGSPEGLLGGDETECLFRAERSSSTATREERGVKGLPGTTERSAAESYCWA
jgi:hypothetical protein